MNEIALKISRERPAGPDLDPGSQLQQGFQKLCFTSIKQTADPEPGSKPQLGLLLIA